MLLYGSKSLTDISKKRSQFEVFEGSGTPEGAVVADVGDFYINKASPGSMFIKETGAATNTGWNQVDTGSGVDFSQGGNSFGATAILGTNDTFDLNFRTNGVTRLVIDTAGQISVLDGSATTPTYSFISDLDTGLYLQGVGALALTTAGSNSLVLGANVSVAKGQFRVLGGSGPSAPSIGLGTDTDTGIELLNGTVHLVTGGVNTLSTVNGVVTLGVLAGTQTHTAEGNLLLTRKFGNGGAVGSNAMLKLNGNVLTGTTQINVDAATFTGTSAATTSIINFASSVTTEAAAYTVDRVVDYNVNNTAKGAGSTITNRVGFKCNTLTSGVNNGSFTDNDTFLGSYFLHSTSTNPSVLSGQLRGSFGTEALPGYSFDTDTDTGMYRSAANVLAFTTGASDVAQMFGSAGLPTFRLANASGTKGVIHGLVNDGSMQFGGDNGIDQGGNIEVFGDTHATKAGFIQFKNSAVIVGEINASGKWDIGAVAGVQIHDINGFVNQIGTGTVNTFASNIKLPDGSITSNDLAIQFAGQANLGFYRSALGTVRMRAPDVAIFSIFNAGTNDDSILMLENGGTSTGDQLVVYREGSGSALSWAQGRDDSDSGNFHLVQSTLLNAVPAFKAHAFDNSIALNSRQIGLTNNMRLESGAGDLVVRTQNGSTMQTIDPVSIQIQINNSQAMRKLQIVSTANMDIDVSTMTGSFGTTPSVAFAEQMPWFVYLINSNETASGLRLAISRNPTLKVAPSTSDLAYESVASSNDDANTVFYSSAVNENATVTAKPMLLIGGARMTKTGANVWAFEVLNMEFGDAVSERPFEGMIFKFPTGQNGANSGSHLKSAGTVPTWATAASIKAHYKVGLDGYVDYTYTTVGAGNCTNGSGGNNLSLQLPYDADIDGSSTNAAQCGGFYAASALTNTAGLAMGVFTGATPDFLLRDYANNSMQDDDFSAVGDDLAFMNIRYKAFGTTI